MELNHHIILIILTIFVSGCRSPQIIVRDVSGNPIEGAKVTGTSLSIGGQYSLTNEKGYAKIPKAVQPTKWISVSKEGYADVEYIDINQPRPILIYLSPQN